MSLADRVVVLNDGNIEQIGSPEEVYNQPHSKFVAGFIGAPTMNFLPCHLYQKKGQLELALTEDLVISVPKERYASYAGYIDTEVILGIRPEHFSIAEEQAPNGEDIILGRINVIEPLGSGTLFFFDVGPTEVVASLPPLTGIRPGDILSFKVNMNNILLFDTTTENRIEAGNNQEKEGKKHAVH
jgi:multiple sugar transport system ATP-binding protein